MLRILLVAALSLIATPALAQTPNQAWANQWNTICATAPDYSQLYVRCHETQSSTAANANMIAAVGQRLEEIPDQVQIASRDQTPIPGRLMQRLQLQT